MRKIKTEQVSFSEKNFHSFYFTWVCKGVCVPLAHLGMYVCVPMVVFFAQMDFIRRNFQEMLAKKEMRVGPKIVGCGDEWDEKVTMRENTRRAEKWKSSETTFLTII